VSLPSQPPRQICFGEFELDLQTAELRTNGHKFTLQGQPFRILAILLEQPGHLVTREELKKRLWPSETFGDFDHGLNRAVNRLRETLQDSAEHPRFIETLPKRGYRFVASQVSPNQPTTALQEHPRNRKAAILVALMFGLTAAIVSAWYLLSHRGSAFESVAVVPFVNQSADPNIEYLSDGISESLIDSLSQIAGLTVRPRSSVLRYKGKDIDPQIVAKDLKVQAVVMGHVSQQGDSLVVSTELVDARNNRSLWGESYDRKLSDVLQVEHDISLEISARLRHKLTREQKVQVSKTATADPEAYQWYLKGRYYWEKRSPDALQQARDYFNQAIARDPAFAQAYVGLADYWAIAPDFLSVALSEALPKEKDAAIKALAIDHNYAPAHLSLANAFFDNWEWANADQEFQRALELDPKLANAHHWYGVSLSFIGRHQEALGHLQRAVELDPLNLEYNANLGQGYLNARQYDRALDQLNKTLQMNPKFFVTYEYFAELYRATGDYKMWLRSWAKKAALNKNSYRLDSVQQLSRAYSAGGYPAAVRRIIDVEKQELPWTYIDPAELAYEYAALGNKDEAFRWLEKAYQERSRLLQTIQIEPSMDALRSDQRYIGLLRRMGLGS